MRILEGEDNDECGKLGEPQNEKKKNGRVWWFIERHGLKSLNHRLYTWTQQIVESVLKRLPYLKRIGFGKLK